MCVCATCGSICAPCGNGVCDKNENKCNCPEDCKKSITVISPNEGEKWVVGNTYQIFWESTGILQTDKIRIAVIDYTNPSNSVESDLIYNLAGNLGAYSWTIPSNFKTGDKYKIKVEACRITQCYSDESDNYFSIVSASTCDQKCKDLGYDAGICRSWAVVPTAEVGCKAGEKDIGYTSDCYVPAGFVGSSRTCCCGTGEEGAPFLTTLKSLENQLASISEAVSQLMEAIKELMKR